MLPEVRIEVEDALRAMHLPRQAKKNEGKNLIKHTPDSTLTGIKTVLTNYVSKINQQHDVSLLNVIANYLVFTYDKLSKEKQDKIWHHITLTLFAICYAVDSDTLYSAVNEIFSEQGKNYFSNVTNLFRNKNTSLSDLLKKERPQQNTVYRSVINKEELIKKFQNRLSVSSNNLMQTVMQLEVSGFFKLTDHHRKLESSPKDIIIAVIIKQLKARLMDQQLSKKQMTYIQGLLENAPPDHEQTSGWARYHNVQTLQIPIVTVSAQFFHYNKGKILDPWCDELKQHIMHSLPPRQTPEMRHK